MVIVNYNYILVTVIFIIFDIATGVIQALINGTFESHKMRQGGLRKLCLLVVIAFGVVLDYSQALVDLGFNFPCLSWICAYISLMEIMSIIDNINMAFPNALPKGLTKMLNDVARDKGVEVEDEDNEENEG